LAENAVERDPDKRGWPQPEGVVKDTPAAALYAAQLDVRKERTKEDIAHKKALIDAEIAADRAYQQGQIDVAKDSITRARSGAEKVQTAASAIITIYTGLLGFAFAISEHPLPARGLIPALLAGLAIVLSTAYLAYLTEPHELVDPEPHGARREMARRRLRSFMDWTHRTSMERSYLLRSSVLALAFAVATLPAPFVTIKGEPEQNAAATASVNSATPNPAVGWPPYPGGDNGTPKLREVLYAAQVREAEELRKVARTEAQEGSTIVDDESEKWWWLGFGLAFLATLGLPKFIAWWFPGFAPRKVRRD